MKRSVLIKALFPVLTVFLLSSAAAFAQVSVTVDIKPGSCKNPINLKSKGVLPVVVFGSDTIEAANIDVASLRLSFPDADPPNEGVAPVRSKLEDVPAVDCAVEDPDGLAEPDGFVDLVLKFRTQDVVKLLPVDVSRGDVVRLVLTGALTDETETETAITGEDTVTILKKKAKSQ